MAASFQFRLSTLVIVVTGWAIFLSVAKTLGAIGCFGLFLSGLLLARVFSDRSVRRSCMITCAGCACLSLGCVDEVFALFVIAGAFVAPFGVLALLGSLKEHQVAFRDTITVLTDQKSSGQEDGMTVIDINKLPPNDGP